MYHIPVGVTEDVAESELAGGAGDTLSGTGSPVGAIPTQLGGPRLCIHRPRRPQMIVEDPL